MYNSDTELLFPLRVVPFLGGIRGADWQALLDKVSAPNVTAVDQVGFVLLMVRMGGCVGCNADSFRAMKGCTLCARQNIKRHRGTDQEMLELFEQTCKEAEIFLGKKNQAS